MNEKNNPKLTRISKVLRKNMTKEEKRLWYDFLKNIPQTVNRQKVIGDYVVDFYCASAKLIIELDGSQHATDSGIKKDAERDAFFNSLGLTVMRIPNFEIHENFNGVCEGIWDFIESASVYAQSSVKKSLLLEEKVDSRSEDG